MANKSKNRLFRWVDNKTDLVWERYNPAKPLQYEDYNNLINLWSSDRTIRKYIRLDDDSIADLFVKLVKSDKYDSEAFFYAFEDDYLVGVVYITSPIDDLEETNIDFLIVNPRLKAKGIGTRMIASIKNNPTFFAEGHNDTFATSIERTNEASKRVFIKNGFKVYNPIASKQSVYLNSFNDLNMSSNFNRWYFTEREMEKK